MVSQRMYRFVHKKTNRDKWHYYAVSNECREAWLNCWGSITLGDKFECIVGLVTTCVLSGLIHDAGIWCCIYVWRWICSVLVKTRDTFGLIATRLLV